MTADWLLEALLVSLPAFPVSPGTASCVPSISNESVMKQSEDLFFIDIYYGNYKILQLLFILQNYN